jgi:hypothetical protein
MAAEWRHAGDGTEWEAARGARRSARSGTGCGRASRAFGAAFGSDADPAASGLLQRTSWFTSLIQRMSDRRWWRPHSRAGGSRVSSWRGVKDILVCDAWAGDGGSGAGLAWGRDGMLYMTTGASNGNAAQEPGSLRGKILRLRDDGSPRSRLCRIGAAAHEFI